MTFSPMFGLLNEFEKCTECSGECLGDYELQMKFTNELRGHRLRVCITFEWSRLIIETENE